MKHTFTICTAVFVAFALHLDASATSAESGAKQMPVKVFILAGQSNMQGKGAPRHLDYLIDDPKSADEFKHLQDADGNWVVRKDVWVWFLDKQGDLTVGFGSGDKIGPELGFGWVVGQHFDEQVLLIKTAWGGHDLKEKFLPPSSGGPGPSYTAMVDHVQDVLANLEDHFPAYEGQGFEIAGFVWHQGFNDAIDKTQKAEQYKSYAERLANLIRDLRREWKSPELPVVIGELGVGKVPGDFQHAQGSVAKLPEFRGNVAFVETHVFRQNRADAFLHIYRLCENKARKAKKANDQEALAHAWDEWNKVKPEFETFASDRGYHYFGSGETFYRMGDAFGKAMLTMIERESRN